MGLFDFLKPKKFTIIELNEFEINFCNSFFPKGEKDILAVANVVVSFSNNKIGIEEARQIAMRSVILSRLARSFTKERLKIHLDGYCKNYLTKKQIRNFHGYLVFLSIASSRFNKTPSDIIEKGDEFVFLK